MDLTQAAITVCTISLIALAALIVWGASRDGSQPDRRLGRLALASVIFGLSFIVVSIFLSQRSASREMYADRAEACTEADTPEARAQSGCGDLIKGEEDPTITQLLAEQQRDVEGSARADRAAGLFADVAKVMIAFALGDAFFKAFAEKWKATPPTA